ncbi:MAG: cell wall-active antibiotics response protein LiaF [Sporolactobacillus sp.]
MSAGKIGAAIAFIFIGCYWLLESLHIISPGMMSLFDEYLPVLVLIFGICLILFPLFSRQHPHYFLGLLLLVYGGLLLAGQHHALDFHWQDFWKLWPFLIIYFGLSLLFGHAALSFSHGGHRHHNSHRHGRNIDRDTGADENRKERSDFIRDASYHEENWTAHPIHERVRIGDYNFDFTKAFIPDETIPIHLSGWVGNIKITLPDDLDFRVNLKAKVGDSKIVKDSQSGVLRNITYQTANYNESSRRIDFNFDFQVIDLRISKV